MSARLLGLFVPLLAACSAGNGGGSVGAGLAPAGAPTHLDLAVSAENEVFFKVFPYATCTLGASGDAKPLKVHSDQDGVVHVSVKPWSQAATQASLDCTTADGGSATYPIELAATSDSEAIAATKRTMDAIEQTSSLKVRPALGGDPMSYTQDELRAGGYGWRPDPKRQPDRYAHWLRAVTSPMKMAPAHRSGGGQTNNGPNESVSYSPIWSGAIAQIPSGDNGDSFYYASTEFYVPQVFAEANFANVSKASTWAGIGGYGTNDLWQAGVGEQTVSGFFAQTASYGAWTQYLPNQQLEDPLNSVPVDNGNDIFVEVWLCDPTINYAQVWWTDDPNIGLCAHMTNYSKNADSGTVFDQLTTFFPGQSAEVIQELPGNADGSHDDYAAFDPFTFLSTQVCSDNFGCNAISTVPNFNVFGNAAPFPITVSSIGSASHPLGEACLSDWDGACDDNGYYLSVWWDAHQ
jgi:hypothetical protein